MDAGNRPLLLVGRGERKTGESPKQNCCWTAGKVPAWFWTSHVNIAPNPYKMKHVTTLKHQPRARGDRSGFGDIGGQALHGPEFHLPCTRHSGDVALALWRERSAGGILTEINAEFLAVVAGSPHVVPEHPCCSVGKSSVASQDPRPSHMSLHNRLLC